MITHPVDGTGTQQRSCVIATAELCHRVSSDIAWTTQIIMHDMLNASGNALSEKDLLFMRARTKGGCVYMYVHVYTCMYLVAASPRRQQRLLA